MWVEGKWVDGWPGVGGRVAWRGWTGGLEWVEGKWVDGWPGMDGGKTVDSRSSMARGLYPGHVKCQ